MKWNFYIILVILLVSSCEKEKFKEGEKRLPNATERGRGIFACYLGDHTYIAKKQQAVTYNQTTGYFFLENINPFYDFRLFVFEGVFGPGTYVFDITGDDVVYGNTFYGIDSAGTNELEITKLDLEEKIVAGTFELDVTNDNGNQLKIRDGRFDLKMGIID